MMLFKICLSITREKNIIKQCKNNKLKTSATACNDEFELRDGSDSVSDIQDYIAYIIKKN